MAKFKFILAAAAFMAFAQIGALAGDLEDTLAASKSGNYETTSKLLEPLAEQGSAEAQFKLGVMYENGYGVAENDAEAVKWYRKAAEQGYVKAQFNLGVMYANGEGAERSLIRAYAWINIAAAADEKGARNAKAIVSIYLTQKQIAEAQRQSAEIVKTLKELHSR